MFCHNNEIFPMKKQGQLIKPTITRDCMHCPSILLRCVSLAHYCCSTLPFY